MKNIYRQPSEVVEGTSWLLLTTNMCPPSHKNVVFMELNEVLAAAAAAESLEVVYQWQKNLRAATL